MAREHNNLKDKICQAVLKLAAKNGWSALTLDDVARAAKVSREQLHKIFSDKNSLLPALVDHTDQRVSEAIGKVDKKATPHDRLFEVLMTRFDILQKNRAGIVAIMKDLHKDPAVMRLLLPAELGAMQKTMSLAQLSPPSKCGPIVQFGLLAVYLRALWEWQRDGSGDMAKTMASLDKSLRFAGMAADILFRKRS